MLSIQNLTKRYGRKVVAVDNLSLEVKAGELYGFIGHNGAGKTSTLRSVAGILRFEEGTILVNGYDVVKRPTAAKRNCTFLPDNPDLYEFLTGIEFLNFIADVYRISSDERYRRIERYSEIFEMTKHLGSPISSYSHGMKQKLALISAFMRKPKLLLLDEPFVGLDPKASFITKELLRELCDDGGAVFFSTHVLEVAEKLCDKIAIIKDGKLMKAGKTQDIVGSSSLEDVFMDYEQNGTSQGGMQP